MAIILVLSESVGDVQSLVSLLAGCMSTAAVKEYLSRMATLLLAIMRKEIRISNRWETDPSLRRPASHSDSDSSSSSSSSRPSRLFPLPRLHYNIYYVLHLMENGPFCVNPGQSG